MKHFFISHFLRTILLRGTALVSSLMLGQNTMAQTAALPGSGNSLLFNGVNSYVNCGNVQRGITQRVTVEAWINTTSSSYQWIAGKYSDQSFEDSGFLLIVNGGRASFAGRAGVGQFLIVTSPITRVDDGQWHHIAGVCNNNRWEIYVDGVLDASQTYSYSTANLASSYPLTIGNYFLQNDFHFNGQIDELRVWRTARSPEEIRANLCQRFASAPSDLVAYYRFDQSSGTALADAGSQPVTGSLLNFPASPWRTSGAAIGDVSISAYPAVSSVIRLSLVNANGDSALVTTLNGPPRGTHLYAVNSAPNVSPSTGAAPAYFGVFGPTLTPGYTLRVRPQNGVAAAQALYTRTDNAATSWTVAPAVRSGGSLTVTTTANRGEYIVADANAWTGAVSSVYTNPANWSANTVPGGNDNVTIPANAVRMPVLGVSASARGFTVASGASMTVAPGGELTLLGALVNNGTFSGNGGLRMGTNGTTQLAGTNPVQIGNLTVGGSLIAIPQNVVVQTPLTVSRVLTLSDNLSMSGNGALTLASDANGTAMVVNNGNAAVFGTVTVQRYLDGSLNAGRGYRHLSAPVTGTSVADLATAAFSPVVNPDYNTMGNTVRPFPTVFSYDQTRVGAANTTAEFDRGWVSPSGLGVAMQPGRGYTVNMTANQTVDFVGTLGNGSISIGGLGRGAGQQAGWHLLGNPYPAPIFWSQVFQNSSGLDNAVYIYKSGGQYAGSYVNGVAANGGSDVIGLGQGFFVRVTTPGGTGSLNLTNAARATSYLNPAVQRTTAETRSLLRLQLRGSGATTDEVVVYLQAGASPGFDAVFDAYKFSQGEITALAVQQGTEQLSISGLPLLTAAPVTVQLTGRVPQAGTFTLQAAELLNLPAGTSAYLRDAQTGAVVNLAQQPSYAFTATNANLAGRFTLELSAGRPTAATAQRNAQISLYPNPAQRELWLQLPATGTQSSARVEILNSLGQVVFGQQLAPARAAGAQRLALPALVAGVYTVRVALADGVAARKFVIE